MDAIKGRCEWVAPRILVVLGVLPAVLSLPAGYIRFQGLDNRS